MNATPESLDVLEKRVLNYLNDSEYKPTIDIARRVVHTKATCTMINPTLYKLKAKNLVTKTSEANGKNPKWKVISDRDIF